MKILIAEDEEDIGEQYKMILEALGHEVILTKDGEECLKTYRDVTTNDVSPFDVVVIDYLMPIKDGITVAKEILKESPKQRIIFVTGHGPKLLSELNDFDEQVEVLVKPLSATALISKIENRRQKEIAKQLYFNLKKWDGTEGLSKPTSQARTAEKINLFPD
jgi:DNA-binding response OmpR family regulator